MSPDTAGLIGLAYTAVVLILVSLLCRVGVDIWFDRRAQAKKRENQHAADIHAYRPPFRPPLVRLVNGRPVMPPRLPVPRSPWLWPAHPGRAMTWSGAAR